MKPYIKNLTTELIRKGRYDLFYDHTPGQAEFRNFVSDDLECGAVRDMTPETLGRIMCAFETGDIAATKEQIFSQVHFAGNPGDMFREMVALMLAYVIWERLYDGPEANLTRYERRRSG